MIAPCGMNCGICRAYGRRRNPCPGCRSDDGVKAKTRLQCEIKNCGKRSGSGSDYCAACGEFPCNTLRRMDVRYRFKYGMSVIGNLAEIGRTGIRAFVENERQKWTCPQCGETLCVHAPECRSCGYVWKRLD